MRWLLPLLLLPAAACLSFDECRADDDCAAGEMCFPDEDRVLRCGVVNLLGGRGACLEATPLDETCHDGQLPACADDGFCVSGAVNPQSGAGTCIARPALGEACVVVEPFPNNNGVAVRCAGDAICSAQRDECVAPPREGEPCFPEGGEGESGEGPNGELYEQPVFCAAGLFCASDDRCRALPVEGEACGQSVYATNACAPGLYCFVEGGDPFGEPGECRGDLAQQDELCRVPFSNARELPPCAPGLDCQEAQACTATDCVTVGLCQPAGLLGDRCDTVCVEGLVCEFQ